MNRINLSIIFFLTLCSLSTTVSAAKTDMLANTLESLGNNKRGCDKKYIKSLTDEYTKLLYEYWGSRSPFCDDVVFHMNQIARIVNNCRPIDRPSGLPIGEPLQIFKSSGEFCYGIYSQ